MLLVFKKKSAHLLATISSVVLISCDPHIDSVYLGRSESKFLDDVNKGNTKAVKAFLDKGGNVNLQDEPGMTPLHHAVNSDWNGANHDTIKLLIGRGADVNAIDDTHHTPLHLASNSKEIAELLIDAGANVDAKDNANRRDNTIFSGTRGSARWSKELSRLDEDAYCQRGGFKCETEIG